MAEETKIVFYGPHDCARGCGKTIVKAAIEQGGEEFDQPEGPIYPNTVWGRHTCEKAEQPGVDATKVVDAAPTPAADASIENSGKVVDGSGTPAAV